MSDNPERDTRPDRPADEDGRDPEVVHLLTLFDFEHLPPQLKAVSRPFSNLAHEMAENFGCKGYDLRYGLHFLIQAKDSLVRQAVTDSREKKN